MVNGSDPQKLIVGVVGVVTGLTIFGDIVVGRQRTTDAIPRRLIGGTLLLFFLLALSSAAPKLASAFAVTIAVIALFVNPDGAKVLSIIANARPAAAAPVAPGTGGSGNLVR